jgi:hypothetical protein
LTFAAAYRLTDVFFRLKKIPLPFEIFGAAVGAGLACWSVAVLHLIFSRSSTPGRLPMRKSILLALAGMTLFSAAVFADETVPAPVPPQDASVTERLDRISKSQEEILNKLAEIKEQLNVIQVRATNR